MTDTFAAQVLSISDGPLRRILLRAPLDFTFAAGQYVRARYPQGVDIPLSIASSPASLPEFELHYRSTPGDELARAFDELLKHPEITFTRAQGNIRCPEKGHILVIAGGTGASLAFSIANQRLPGSEPTTVLWCADQDSEIYASDELAQLVTELNVLVDNRRTEKNTCLAWLAQNAHPEHHQHVIIGGSPGFVYAVTDVLTEKGFMPSALQSDVYEYAPR